MASLRRLVPPFPFAFLLAVAVACLPAMAPTRAIAQVPATEQGEGSRPRERLRTFGLRLDQIERTLGGRELSDDALRQLRQLIDPIASAVDDIVVALTPLADAVKARLDQLGPKPASDAAPESADVAREREERQKELNEINEGLRIARALKVQADQLVDRILDRRHAIFARTLFSRSTSLVDPDLWIAVFASLPADVTALRLRFGDWLSAMASKAGEGRMLMLLGSLLAAIGLFVVRARLKPRVAARDARVENPSRLRRSLTGVWRIVLVVLPAALAAWLIYHGLNSAYPLPQNIEPVVRALMLAIVLVAGARALAETMLAPRKPGWRILPVDDGTAQRLTRLVSVGSLVIAAGKVLETVLQSIGAGLHVTIATKGSFAVLAALALVDALRRIRSAEEGGDADPAREGGAIAIVGAFRIVAWAIALVVIAAALVGYIALASFLVDQFAWIATVLTVLALALIVIDETVGRAFAGKSRLVMALQASVGLRRRSLDQLAVLTAGLLRVLFIIAAIMLILAPWGVESADVASSMRAAFFGLSVGGITLSVSTAIGALLLFIAIVLATRAVQRWLERRYLPVTQLDSGLRNSIKTAVGYLGVFVAAALALAQLGLSLDRIAIVAGALSVGIGFGLQSVVNNFVSGLILLWERSIRVGDWVVVGTEQGYVRRINVRATEIETFDKAEVIVPNSSLVSGVVKNWLHNNRTGRIVIPVTVAFGPDPRKMADLLIECARAHRDVLRDPAPSVLFSKFSNTALDFELRCFVVDVEESLRVKSDLHFVIYARLTDEKIVMAAPVSEVKVSLPEHVETLLARVAEGQAGAEEAAAQARTTSAVRQAKDVRADRS